MYALIALISFIFLAHSQCCLNCQSWTATGCQTCSSNFYLYDNKICLYECPTGFTVTNGQCINSLSPNTLFDLDFSQFTSLASSTAGDFTTYAQQQFFSMNFQTLIPSKDRGFYSSSSSAMISTISWVPSPDITFNFWVYPYGSGSILQTTYGGGSYGLIFSSSSSNYTVYFQGFSQASHSVTQYTFTGPTPTGVWDLIRFQLSQSTSTAVLLNFWMNSVNVQSTYTNLEQKLYGPYSWVLGTASTGGAFTGFIYRIRVDQELSADALAAITAPACQAGKYWDGSQCLSFNCPWPLCVGSSCGICDSCLYCYGYTASECVCDGTLCCQAACESCSSFYYCDSCANGYTNSDGICEIFVDTSIIAQNFSGDFAGYYGEFRTGASGSLYYFMNNPESVDPVPAHARGLYFSNGMYLEYNTTFSLNSDFAIGMWIKPISGGVFYKGSEIYLSNYYYGLSYYDLLGTAQIATTDPSAAFTTWGYVSVSVCTDATGVTLTSYLDNLVISTKVLLLASFRDTSASPLILGKTSSSNYQGFIYSIKIWDTALAFFAYEYLDEICGKSMASGCLSECSMQTYLYRSCTSCSNGCSTGCVDSRTTCTICSSYLCEYCSNFATTTCEQCVANASGQPCACNAGYYEAYYICNICYSRCLTCTAAGYICSSCLANYVYLQGLCLGGCPSGYTLSGTSCVLSSETVLAVNLGTTTELGVIGTLQVGSNNANIYPNFDINDPWPSTNRGYYFKSGLYLSTSLAFSPILSLSLWVRIVNSGNIISKSGVLLLQATTIASYAFSMVLMQGSSLSDTQSVLSGTWNYIGYSLTFTSSTSTYLQSYQNTVLKSSKYFGGFVSDSSSSTLYIGGSSGFEGFILSAGVYSTSSHYSDSYSLSCSNCSPCYTCLSTCEILQDPDNNCSSCPAACTYGCVSQLCNVCSNPLCIICGDRVSDTCQLCTTNAGTVNCACTDGYYPSGSSCELCYSSCTTCSAGGYACNTCTGGFLIQAQICVDECSTGYYASGSQCLANYTSILDLDLSDAILLGEIAGMQVGSLGNNSYPSYDSSDPWPLPSRGYYFSAGAYMSGPLTFSPVLSFSVWLYIDTAGVILSKTSAGFLFNLTSYAASLNLTLNTMSQPMSALIPYPAPSWLCLTGVLSIQAYVSTLQVYSGSTALTSNSSNSYLLDTLTTFAISSVSGGFTGFLWKLKILNIASQTVSLDATAPTSQCSAQTYAPACTACPTCSYGCNAGSCNICTDQLCYQCTSFSLPCAQCSHNSTLVSGICVCNAGFYDAQGDCKICYNQCKTCSHGGIGDCLGCYDGKYLIKGICGICGIGYEVNNGNCELAGEIAFSLNFNDTIQGVITDSAGGINVITGDSQKFYPNYESSDPYSAYLRGYYFNGNSSFMQITDSEFLLPFNFTIDIWLNPLLPDGVILSKNSTSLYFASSVPYFFVNLTSQSARMTCNNLLISTWNHFTISLSFSSSLSTINCGVYSTFSGYFIDESVGAYIGTNTFSFLKGFIYTITISTTVPSTRRLAPCLDSCDQCLDSGYCIPNCDITAFWTGPHYNNCSACLSYCNQGCVSNQTCNICANDKCDTCTGFDTTSCTSCVSGAQNTIACECPADYFWNPIELKCFQCNSNEYLSGYSCLGCPDLCADCVSSAKCGNCLSHAELSNNLCTCSIGYLGTLSCTRNLLNITLTVTASNQVLIVFSQPLNNTLTVDDISVAVSISAVWMLVMWSANEYQLALNFTDAVSNSTTVVVEFTDATKIVSTSNGTPDVYKYTTHLHEIVNSDLTLMDQAKALGQTVATAATSAVVGISMMNPNPACLWSFINTVQMIVFIVLATVPIPPRSKGLLIGLKNYNIFPNIFQYFVSEGEPHGFPNAYDLGYASDSVIINTGKSITAFIFFIVLWGFIKILLRMIKKGYCDKKWYVSLVKEFDADYKYGFFIRYAIANYIEFEIAALIGLSNFRNVGIYSILNTILSILILIACAATPVLCLVMVIKRRSRPQQEAEEFESLYGTLFYEFNDDKGLGTSNFYVFFFLKRAAFGVILIFLGSYGILQMSLTVTICFAYLLYILMFMPFGEKILNWSNLFSELATLVIFCLVAWCLFEISLNTRDNLDSAIYYSVNAIMACQMLASLSVLTKSIIDKLRARVSGPKGAKVTPVLSFEASERAFSPINLEESRIENFKRFNTQDTRKFNNFFSD